VVVIPIDSGENDEWCVVSGQGRSKSFSVICGGKVDVEQVLGVAESLMFIIECRLKGDADVGTAVAADGG
jgi:hypothetical protein